MPNKTLYLARHYATNLTRVYKSEDEARTMSGGLAEIVAITVTNNLDIIEQPTPGGTK